MEDEVVFYVFVMGGLAVLLSYILIYVSGTLTKLMPILTKDKTFYTLWKCSVFLVVLSVLYIMIYYSFYERFDSDYRTLFISCLFVFLIFCLCWPISVEYIVKYKGNPELQRPILLLVALATIGFLTCIVLNNKTENSVLLIAGILVLIHHLFFDGIIWVNKHNNYVKI